MDAMSISWAPSQASTDVMNESLVLMNGTIELAEEFNCRNSLVCFYTESNKDCTFANDLNESSIYGSTAKCWTDSDDISFFWTPFQIQIKLKNSNLLTDLRPILYLKVLSFDYWNRLVSESYGFVELPIRTGRHTLSVKTWKPFIGNRLERMKEFFIGSVPLVHNLHKESTQTNSKSSNNYGFESQSSGSVVIGLDVLIQTQSPKVINRDKYKIKNSSVDSMKQNILSVVLAFQRAKNRMDSIRNEFNQSNRF